MTKLKILCDVDLLCKGTISQKERTGVYNLCKYIVENLNQIDAVELTLCSHKFPKKYVKQYIQQNPNLKNLAYFQIGNSRQKLKYFFQTQAFIAKDKYKTTKKINHKISYVFYKLLRSFYKLMPKISYFVDRKINNYDVYHSCFYPLPKVILKNHKIKNGMTIQDMSMIKYPEFYNLKIDIDDYKKNNKTFGRITPDTTIFCISESTKKDLLEIYPKFKENKIAVTPLAVDKKKFYYLKERDKKNSKDRKSINKSLQKYGIPLNKPYFVTLSSLNPRKNLSFLLAGFLEFLEKNKLSDVNLVLAGPEGWKYDELLSQIKANKKYAKNIILTNFIDDKDINNIYNGAEGFICASLYEGFGLPVLEAMQCGIPVISSDVTSLPEVVGDAGILINPKEKVELIKALEKIYKNKKVKKKLSRKSLNRAGAFSWQKTAEEIVNSYER